MVGCWSKLLESYEKFRQREKVKFGWPDGFLRYYHDDLHKESSKWRSEGGNLMVWRAVGWRGVFDLVFLEGNMNAANHVDFPSNNLRNQATHAAALDSTFQQDCAPIPIARIVLEWFWNVKIVVLDWHSKSPYLNPMRNLWGYLREEFMPTASNFRTNKTWKYKSYHVGIQWEETLWIYPIRLCDVIQNSRPTTKY